MIITSIIQKLHYEITLVIGLGRTIITQLNFFVCIELEAIVSVH